MCELESWMCTCVHVLLEVCSLFKAMRGTHSHWVLLHLITVCRVSVATGWMQLWGDSVRLCMCVWVAWPCLPVSALQGWLCQAALVFQRLILPTAQHRGSHCCTASPLFISLCCLSCWSLCLFLTLIFKHKLLYAPPLSKLSSVLKATKNLQPETNPTQSALVILNGLFHCLFVSCFPLYLWFYFCIRCRPSR